MPKGEAPRFFRIQEGVRPANCTSELQLFSGNQLIVSSDGRLYVHEISKNFDGPNFCVDKDVALVCNRSLVQPSPNNLSMAGIGSGISAAAATLPTKSKLRKCCGPNAVYDKSKQSCVGLSEGSVHQGRVVTNYSGVDMIYGFPQCKSDAQFTMVGAYRDEDFNDSTGVFKLNTGRIFSSSEFCVEHTVADDVYGDVHAFTCADQFVQMDPISVEATDQQVNNLFFLI